MKGDANPYFFLLSQIATIFNCSEIIKTIMFAQTDTFYQKYVHIYILYKG